MKRSIITATLLTGAALLSACNEEQEEAINFQTVSQCMQQRPAGEDFDDWEKMCENAIIAAKSEHERTGPRYAPSGSDGDDLCEEYHGDDQCYEVTDANGDSFWMPFLMGYVVSSAIDDISGKRYYNYNKSQPLYYSSKSKSYMTSTGTYTTTKTYGRTTVKRGTVSAPKARPKVYTTTTVKRTTTFAPTRTTTTKTTTTTRTTTTKSRSTARSSTRRSTRRR